MHACLIYYFIVYSIPGHGLWQFTTSLFPSSKLIALGIVKLAWFICYNCTMAYITILLTLHHYFQEVIIVLIILVWVDCIIACITTADIKADVFFYNHNDFSIDTSNRRKDMSEKPHEATDCIPTLSSVSLLWQWVTSSFPCFHSYPSLLPSLPCFVSFCIINQ